MSEIKVRAYGDACASYVEIAASLDISPQGVQFLERQALKKCQRILSSRGLSMVDFLCASMDDVNDS